MRRVVAASRALCSGEIVALTSLAIAETTSFWSASTSLGASLVAVRPDHATGGGIHQLRGHLQRAHHHASPNQ